MRTVTQSICVNLITGNMGNVFTVDGYLMDFHPMFFNGYDDSRKDRTLRDSPERDRKKKKDGALEAAA